MIKKIAVVGAGTMGSGIALAAALGKFPVILCDINPGVLNSAKESIEFNLSYLLRKDKITEGEKATINSSIIFTSNINECIADVVIEAIVEKLEIKEKLFLQLAAINGSETILASNTSSLSISAIQKNVPGPQRVAGLHFFNPAHIMKLVEVVKGETTSDDVISSLKQLCLAINKVPVVCKDSPGFIVNRVARHFYLEALYMVEKNLASPQQIDEILKASGFKMGPFELMDLIGMDINLAVSTSLYEAFNQADRFKPSALQTEKVQNGELGRKTGKGFYDYADQHKN
jgi:3-hydroxybutyryl-CoA dehydrogenase